MVSDVTTTALTGRSGHWGLAGVINRAQSSFVGLLRVLSIPIVLMLSIASGYTTYYGMAYFITWWIALIITIAIQSIVVISSLEIAGIHWRANRTRYLSVVMSLLVAVSASITFSYFKFYEISEQNTIGFERMTEVRQSLKGYLGRVQATSQALIGEQRSRTEAANEEAQQAYLGTHPSMNQRSGKKIGAGPFWRKYNDRAQREQKRLDDLLTGGKALGSEMRTLRATVAQFITGNNNRQQYQAIIVGLTTVEGRLAQLAVDDSRPLPAVPLLPAYDQFTQGVTPSFAMWKQFSLFAFACAVMVDFFTILLSYRLEFTAPGPLSEGEEAMVFECLSQFQNLRINRNDELEMAIEKSVVERARRTSDWSRKFGVAFLLSRGYLRKVGDNQVEFAPNLYPIIADQLRKKQLARLEARQGRRDE